MQGKLGEGGYGSVWIGKNKLSGVKRAIKTIPKNVKIQGM